MLYNLYYKNVKFHVLILCYDIFSSGGHTSTIVGEDELAQCLDYTDGSEHCGQKKTGEDKSKRLVYLVNTKFEVFVSKRNTNTFLQKNESTNLLSLKYSCKQTYLSR